MNMKAWMAFGLALLVSGCERAPSTFAFDVVGTATQRVHSSGTVRGEVDDGGYLALDDDAWGLKMSLGGLAPGSRTLAKGGGELVIMSKVTGDVFTTGLGGSCTVWVDPHEDTNGSAITGWFTCTGLPTGNGDPIDVKGGRFGTFLNDAANNPQHAPPTPGASRPGSSGEVKPFQLTGAADSNMPSTARRL